MTRRRRPPSSKTTARDSPTGLRNNDDAQNRPKSSSPPTTLSSRYPTSLTRGFQPDKWHEVIADGHYGKGLERRSGHSNAT